MADQILKVQNLSKSFDGQKLFHDVDLSLTGGTINSLFGSNGSGKTTFFNLIGGYDKPDSGQVFFRDRAVRFGRQDEIARSGLGRMWQTPALFPNHTLIENLLVSDRANPGEKLSSYLTRWPSIINREKVLLRSASETLDRFELTKKKNHLVGTLSLGERKLLNIGMLFMSRASLLMLDEPFSGITPETIRRISLILREMKDQGKTVFMIEHKTSFAECLSDCIYRIESRTIRQVK